MIHPNSGRARKIVEGSMDALGLRMDMKTDPEVIRVLLKEMRLDDFRPDFAPMKKFFADALSRPQSLKPMFESIIDGICTKHPAVVEFAELALSKKWFSPSPHILRSAHVTYILEAMTAAMCNSRRFFLEAEKHVRSREEEYGLHHSRIVSSFWEVYRSCHSLLETMKTLSVDPVMIIPKVRKGLSGAWLRPYGVNNLAKKLKLNFIERRLLSAPSSGHLEHTLQLLRLNIYEAGITEFKNGCRDNACCAHALSEDIVNSPPRTKFSTRHAFPVHSRNRFYEDLASEHDNCFASFQFSQEWVSLYVAWNMAFMLGGDTNIHDLDILMPKLFIPSLINCDSINFISVRSISLWLSIANEYFRLRDRIHDVLGPRNRRDMAKAWGEINKKYALRFLKVELKEAPEEFSIGFQRFFAHPIFHFFKLVEDFFVH